MGELYSAMLQYMDEVASDEFPPEIDNFLHHAPLEWRRLGVCPASHRRFSIQLIPHWLRADIERNPGKLLAYDYNENELRLQDLWGQKVTVNTYDEETEQTTETERSLTEQEYIAVLTGKYFDLDDGTESSQNVISQLKAIRGKLLGNGTLARNFKEGHVILLLDGTVKYVTDREFAQYRLEIFHRELIKLARANEGKFPSTVAAAMAKMQTYEHWWLRCSLSINPGTDDFIGFEMNPAGVTLESPVDTPLMYDKDSSAHKLERGGKEWNGRNVLFRDGTVEFMIEVDFQKQIVPLLGARTMPSDEAD
ncbi:MAG: hypothetical protein U5N86_11515 [Planctomycetota bacterium]|nr:hypothetical protein [Planctomycetota bacterium]